MKLLMLIRKKYRLQQKQKTSGLNPQNETDLTNQNMARPERMAFQ